MLLTFDFGNSETTIGLFDGETLDAHWRIMTDVPRTSDEMGVLLRGFLAGAGMPIERVEGVAIGSVVPRITQPLADACRDWLSAPSVRVIDAAAAPASLRPMRRRSTASRRTPCSSVA